MKLQDSTALLTKRELAAKFHVCIRTVDSWVNRKLIGYIKIGNSVRFTPSDVEAFIQKHRIGAPCRRRQADDRCAMIKATLGRTAFRRQIRGKSS